MSRNMDILENSIGQWECGLKNGYDWDFSFEIGFWTFDLIFWIEYYVLIEMGGRKNGMGLGILVLKLAFVLLI